MTPEQRQLIEDFLETEDVRILAKLDDTRVVYWFTCLWVVAKSFANREDMIKAFEEMLDKLDKDKEDETQETDPVQVEET